MKITVSYNESVPNKTINISSVKYLGDYTLDICFNDSTEKRVDFKSFLSKAQHPSIKKYLDKNIFSKYEIVDGNLNWNDFELVFPIWDLYQGKI